MTKAYPGRDGHFAVAVVGCGRWGPNQIRALSSVPGLRVTLCVETDAARLREARELFPSIEAASDVERALRDPSISAVAIATPTATHAGLVRRALAAGKHVLCEKPLCEKAGEARVLAALARRKKLVLMGGHVFLFNGGLVKVKELIDSGELGRLRYLSAVRTNLGPIRDDVNAAYDLASHDVAVFNWLLSSRPDQVSATGACFVRPGVEDVAFLSLRYPGGVYANIHASWLNPKKVRQVIVVGSLKMVSWDDLELSAPVAVYDKGADRDGPHPNYGEFLRVAMWDGEVRLPKVDLEEPLKAQARAFRDALRAGRAQRSDGEFSAGVVAALEAAVKSMRSGGRPVAVPE